MVLVFALIALTTSANSLHINSAAEQQTSGVRANEVIPLGPNSRVQRNLEASATNVHPLTFEVGQFARIVVEQKGVDEELIHATILEGRFISAGLRFDSALLELAFHYRCQCRLHRTPPPALTGLEKLI